MFHYNYLDSSGFKEKHFIEFHLNTFCRGPLECLIALGLVV